MSQGTTGFDAERRVAELQARQAAEHEPLRVEDVLIRDDGWESPLVNLTTIGRDIVGFETGTHGTMVIYRDHVELWPADAEGADV